MNIISFQKKVNDSKGKKSFRLSDNEKKKLNWLIQFSQPPKKGVAGINTGEKTRKVIDRAINKGFTIKEIAQAAKRSEDVIRSIISKEIKNPPRDLVDNIKKLIK